MGEEEEREKKKKNRKKRSCEKKKEKRKGEKREPNDISLSIQWIVSDSNQKSRIRLCNLFPTKKKEIEIQINSNNFLKK